MLEQVKDNIGEVAQQTVADAGYVAITELAKAEAQQLPVVVNLPEALQQNEDQPYHASHFVWDADKDHSICPQGQILTFDSIKHRDKGVPYDVRVYRCGSYETCPVRWQCSSSKTGRTVQIHPNHDVLLRCREKLKDEDMRKWLRKRGSMIEPLFEQLQQGMTFRLWTVRGLENVRNIWLLLWPTMTVINDHVR